MAGDMGVFVLTFALVGAYFLPSIVAAARGHAASGWVFAVNLTWGWTWYGWLIAMIWALAGATAYGHASDGMVELSREAPDPEDSDPDGGERRPVLLQSRRATRIRRFRRGLPASIAVQGRFIRRRTGSK